MDGACVRKANNDDELSITCRVGEQLVDVHWAHLLHGIVAGDVAVVHGSGRLVRKHAILEQRMRAPSSFDGPNLGEVAGRYHALKRGVADHVMREPMLRGTKVVYGGVSPRVANQDACKLRKPFSGVCVDAAALPTTMAAARLGM